MTLGLVHPPLRASTAAATCPRSRGTGTTRPPYARTGEVDTVDGFVLVLSPWAVRNVRFDESLGKLHGYDFDFCLQVREAGRKVVTADFRAIHHHSLELVSDPETWIDAHIRVAEKWDGRMPGHRRGAAATGAARAARRGGARRCARDAGASPRCCTIEARDARARARARTRRATSISLAAHGAAAPPARGAGHSARDDRLRLRRSRTPQTLPALRASRGSSARREPDSRGVRARGASARSAAATT